MLDGQFLPEIANNFCQGFGYSWNLFYPPLSTYISAFFKIFVEKFVTSMNLTVIFSLIVGSISMYKLVKDITQKNETAFITATIYVTSVYYIVDIYIRMAMGELMTLMFLPILARGLYNIFYGDKGKHYLITIGAAGILLSHNISAMFTCIISICFLLIHIKQIFNKENNFEILKKLCINAIFIIGIVSFFYIPFIESINNAEYLFNQDGKMASADTVLDNGLVFHQLIFGKAQWGISKELKNGFKDEMPFNLGISILIPLLFTPFIYKKIPKEKRKIYNFSLITGLFTMYMATIYFPWDKMPKILIMIQFSWRMLLYSNFLLSIVAGVNIEKLFTKVTIKEIFIILLILGVYTQYYLSNILVPYNEYDESYLYEKEEIQENAISSKLCSGFEYWPVKVKSSYLVTRSEGVIVLSGDAEIINENKSGSHMSFDIIKVNQDSEIELPYIYYIGYTVNLNGEKIDTKETENGFLRNNLKFRNGRRGQCNIYWNNFKQNFSSYFNNKCINVFGVCNITRDKKEKKQQYKKIITKRMHTLRNSNE